MRCVLGVKRVEEYAYMLGYRGYEVYVVCCVLGVERVEECACMLGVQGCEVYVVCRGLYALVALYTTHQERERELLETCPPALGTLKGKAPGMDSMPNEGSPGLDHITKDSVLVTAGSCGCSDKSVLGRKGLFCLTVWA